MCIAIIKGSGEKLPDNDTLNACWEGNKDGGGYSYVAGGKVLIKKGFMNKDQFFAALKRDITEDTTAFIHMRIATHGGVNQECTHPFPLTDNYDEMRKLETETEMAIVHNGVFSNVNGLPDKVSDTMFYIKEVLMRNRDWLEKDKEMPWLFKTSVGSCRLAWMTAKYCIYAGDWTKDCGCFFSNTQYKRRYQAWPEHFQFPGAHHQTGGGILWTDISSVLDQRSELTGGTLRRRLESLVSRGILIKNNPITLGEHGKPATIGRRIRKELSSLMCETCSNNLCDLSPTCALSGAAVDLMRKSCLSNPKRPHYIGRNCVSCAHYSVNGNEEPCRTCSTTKHAGKWESRLTVKQGTEQ